MSFLGWMAAAGGLLLLIALSSAYLRRLPVSTAVLYMLLGVAFGPLGLGLLRVDVRESAPWLERLTEIAVIVSLFVGGLKLRLHWRNPAWTAAYLLMGPVMLACILGVALMARFFLGLDTASALLLGALLAPTDPVLAGTVSVNDAADHDRMRYGLSGEAGLNDGMAFPFVIFGLLWAEHGGAGGWIGGWALHRLLWAVPAALVLGHALGKGVGRLAVWLRSRHRDTAAPSDFLALALIALSYVGAEVIGAWGFLAVFAAGVGLRSAELKVVRENPHPEASPPEATEQVEGAPPHPPAEDLVSANVAAEALEEPAVAAGALVAETLSFGDTAERLLEVLLVVLVGVSLAVHWDARAVPLALALMIVLRPLATLPLLARAPISRAQRWLMGWFGIRGIGSLYYLSYALNHGMSGRAATDLANLTLSVVAISILGHGITAQPFLGWYERALGKREGKGGASAPSSDQTSG
jgi:NhaP-type Na+/H+ or K+/H+ antiporter